MLDVEDRAVPMTWWASFNNTTNWWDIWHQWHINILLWSIHDM